MILYSTSFLSNVPLKPNGSSLYSHENIWTLVNISIVMFITNNDLRFIESKGISRTSWLLKRRWIESGHVFVDTFTRYNSIHIPMANVPSVAVSAAHLATFVLTFCMAERTRVTTISICPNSRALSFSLGVKSSISGFCRPFWRPSARSS